MKPNADDLSQYTEADFTALEQAVGKERKQRNKIARARARLEQLMAKREGEKTPPSIAPVARGAFDGKPDFSKG
jgi:low affinity Fe/Cu permease